MLKHNKFFFLTIYALVFLPIISLYLGGIYLLLVPFTIFIIVPVFDFILHDPYNPSEDEIKILTKKKFYHHILIPYLPIHITLIIGCMFYILYYPLSYLELVMLGAMVGIITGSIGINIAHELMHKPGLTDQIISRILLVLVCYGHFVIEHVRGHHINVATKNDPATARLDESIYHFLPRVIVGSFLSAWKIESKRLRRHRKPIYHWKNEFYWIIIVPTLLAIFSFMISGWMGVIFFFLQSFVAILMLEVINYIEHYGLSRPKLINGHYEPMGPKYSWDADHWLSNHILFNLMRHADHHTHGAKPYQSLVLQKESPKLPGSYATLYWVTFMPKLWFSIMNPKVKAHQSMSKDAHIAS